MIGLQGKYLSHPIHGNLLFTESKLITQRSFQSSFFDIQPVSSFFISYSIDYSEKHIFFRAIIPCILIYPQNCIHDVLQQCKLLFPNLFLEKNFVFSLHLQFRGIHPSSFSVPLPCETSQPPVYIHIHHIYLEFVMDLLECQQLQNHCFNLLDFLAFVEKLMQSFSSSLQGRLELFLNWQLLHEEQQLKFAGPLISNTNLFWKFRGPQLFSMIASSLFLQQVLNTLTLSNQRMRIAFQEQTELYETYRQETEMFFHRLVNECILAIDIFRFFRLPVSCFIRCFCFLHDDKDINDQVLSAMYSVKNSQAIERLLFTTKWQALKNIQWTQSFLAIQDSSSKQLFEDLFSNSMIAFCCSSCK